MSFYPGPPTRPLVRASRTPRQVLRAAIEENHRNPTPDNAQACRDAAEAYRASIIAENERFERSQRVDRECDAITNAIKQELEPAKPPAKSPRAYAVDQGIGASLIAFGIGSAFGAVCWVIWSLVGGVR